MLDCFKKSFKKKKKNILTFVDYESQSQSATARFPEGTLAKIEEEFKRVTRNKPFMDKVNFKEVLGILGIDSGENMANRIFESLDPEGKGQLEFGKFIEYIGKLFYGFENEKAELSYRFIDVKNKGSFRVKDLEELIRILLEAQKPQRNHDMSFGKMEIRVDTDFESEAREIAQFMFELFDIKKKGWVTRDDFFEVMEANPEVMNFFDLINKGFAEKIAISSQNSTIKQHYESLLLIEKEIKMARRQILFSSSNNNIRSSQIDGIKSLQLEGFKSTQFEIIKSSQNLHSRSRIDSKHDSHLISDKEVEIGKIGMDIQSLNSMSPLVPNQKRPQQQFLTVSPATVGNGSMNSLNENPRKIDSKIRMTMVSQNFYEFLRRPSGSRQDLTEEENHEEEKMSLGSKQVSEPKQVVPREEGQRNENIFVSVVKEENNESDSMGGPPTGNPEMNLNSPMLHRSQSNLKRLKTNDTKKDDDPPKALKIPVFEINRGHRFEMEQGKGDQDSLVSQDEERKTEKTDNRTLELTGEKRQTDIEKKLRDLDDRLALLLRHVSQTKDTFFINIMQKK